ncbi:MAG: MBL fold metallo-hydrolase, partial [Candidatus Sericytochromatia bacterium]|nr:MBL fold metallo-hydrolase [Candidatus Sericytochromatia bacterium]
MEICTLASGSSGNATLIRDGETVILIDAGLSGLGLASAMQRRGIEPHQVSAIWLTHEHGDHVRVIRFGARKRP